MCSQLCSAVLYSVIASELTWSRRIYSCRVLNVFILGSCTRLILGMLVCVCMSSVVLTVQFRVKFCRIRSEKWTSRLVQVDYGECCIHNCMVVLLWYFVVLCWCCSCCDAVPICYDLCVLNKEIKYHCMSGIWDYKLKTNISTCNYNVWCLFLVEPRVMFTLCIAVSVVSWNVECWYMKVLYFGSSNNIKYP